MGKERVTKKYLKERYKIINTGNGNLQNLLQYTSPSFYCTRVEGWACDAYIFGDYAILDGYDCIGKLVSIEIMKKYDEKARKILDKYREGSRYYTYNRIINTLEKLIMEFIKEVS